MVNLNGTLITRNQILKSLAILFGLVFLGFVIVYRKWSFESWNYPVSYSSDNLAVLFLTKMYSRFEFIPYLSKSLGFMNVPLGAHFDDIPNNDDPLYFLIGMFQRLFGLFPGSNLVLLLIMTLNAWSFYFILLYYKIKNFHAIAGATAFALSHFFFLRGFQHIMITEAWMLPLCLLVVDWLFKPEVIWTKRKNIFSIFVAIVTGLSFVYYTFIFIQLILICIVKRFLHGKGLKYYTYLKLIFFSILGLAIGQLDTIFYQIQNGKNLQALTRNISDVEQYSLKIPDLFIPASHLWTYINHICNQIYYGKTYLIHTELGYEYLGVVGIIAFVFSIFTPVVNVLKEKKQDISSHTIFLYWILAFSISGGINLLISIITGLYVFRCTNRYSILIMIISLTFFLKRVGPRFGKWFSVLIIIITFFDLPSRMRFDDYASIKTRVDSDRAFVGKLEELLPKGSKIFQLPVVDFPEYPNINQMTDYEHFRPIFYTDKYSWSTGGTKGRSGSDWQREVEKMQFEEMVLEIKKKGFTAVFLNRKAYLDKGNSVIEKFTTKFSNPEYILSDEYILFKIGDNVL